MKTTRFSHSSKTISSGLLALALLVSLSLPANAWWNSEWKLRKKITIDPSSLKLGGEVESVPVLIRLHEGVFRFADAQEDGSDLRIIAEDDKTPLAFHIEKYDPLLNEAFLWVKLPRISPAGKPSFWIYYSGGNAAAAKPEPAGFSFDAETLLVYHFADKGGAPGDSSSNANNASNGTNQKTAIAVEGSLIGPGIRLEGKPGFTIPGSSSLEWKQGAAFTWSAWVKPTGPAGKPNAGIFSRLGSDGSGEGLRIGWEQTGPFVEVTKASKTERSPAGTPVPANGWHHLVLISTGSELQLWVDGVEYSKLAGSIPALTQSATLGAEEGFAGELDELQISKVARSSGWIQLAAAGQGTDSKLVVLGEDEVAASWVGWLSSGYFGIILRSLTTDGWIVIGILLVMSAISWVVMISKLRYLNRISRGNYLFMQEWERLSADPALLAKANESSKSIGEEASEQDQRAIRLSSIYRIYQIGAQQIQHRLALRPQAPKSLTSRGIQAVRARLDGGLVRETERLNRQIVLLTIAISGGPFLGLLGTVIGVMITFAAVAAAGDVNVNAIAPGIAAALLATVAGLAVAIPALFGYNYLLTRIKGATNDMHVFIDEFVTSMAEVYRGGPPD